ncbi:tigger transposable element-derived protein 1-like [Macrobrachium nipponense]|uniref:tigger transposable element-derived protein 1-like n=1 Tax=Macrobrachium nipponense TaxID=159736 RepID=UPI0030C82310
MAPKRPASGKASGNEPKQVRKVMTLQQKVELLDMLKAGNSFAAVGRHFAVNESTVRSIQKEEVEIRKAVGISFLGSAKKMSTVRDQDVVRMESALALWIHDCRKKNVPLGRVFICEKAWQLYAKFSNGSNVAQEADFLGFDEASDEEEPKAGPSSALQEFQASKGWFQRFMQRFQLKHVSLHGEAASADVDAAQNYPETFKKLISDKGYCPQQVFNMDETGLFWKRMPSRTCIMKDEARASGFKAHKDRVTLIMCGNAAGFMLKPGLIYNSAKPRALKNKNMHTLPVFWMHNSKAWITKVLMERWFLQSFIPQVKQYLSDLCMEFKVLLLMDNARGHPADLCYEGVQIKFLPANTTSLLQPMDQGVIRAFKALYTRNSLDHLVKAMDDDSAFTLKAYWRKFTIATCLNVIDRSLRDMKKETLNSCWKKLWPECVND